MEEDVLGSSGIHQLQPLCRFGSCNDPLSVAGYINSSLSVALVRVTILCLRGVRDPTEARVSPSIVRLCLPLLLRFCPCLSTPSLSTVFGIRDAGSASCIVSTVFGIRDRNTAGLGEGSGDCFRCLVAVVSRRSGVRDSKPGLLDRQGEELRLRRLLLMEKGREEGIGQGLLDWFEPNTAVR
jgi:hypothetical protein